MTDFSPTQGRYLAYIHAYTEGFGLSPSESEIAAALGVSPPSVNQMMKTLEKKGLIRRQRGVPRSIEILIERDALPKWKGKRIARAAKVWTRNVPGKKHKARRASGRAGAVYRFKIALQDTDPAIWRRIETKDVTLEQLHELIQTAMGWTNSHLHQFEIAGRQYADPRFMMNDLDDFGALDYSGVRVSDLTSEHGTRLRIGYEYDFGDGWRHEIVLEEIAQPEPGISYPRCIGGARACPPEDVGGVYGFAEYVEAITDPGHSEHDEWLEWSGPFDPAKFDVAQTTRRMRKGLPAW
ncbi:MAG TPA: helix-turn-helix domain-containing protein [Woeseiaceae bacterium]|nr:helix-turn-helix domain-containing protein [Woeseiaceae bacterium]